MVRRWEAQGIPLSIVLRGMDRYFDRLAARPPRRRPARVEFCEADVLDLFDEWRRAVGAGAMESTRDAAPDEARPARRGPSLAAHLDRVLTRLSSTLATRDLDEGLRNVASSVLHEVGALRDGARGLRGEARTSVLDRLAVLDEDLMGAAMVSLDAATREDIDAACRRDLAPFVARMSAAALADAMRTARVHAARERLGLPRVAMERE
jgi:hypothetical protein